MNTTNPSQNTLPADAISREQWFDPKFEPPIDFPNKAAETVFKLYRRFLWLMCKLSPKTGVGMVMKHFYQPRRFPRPRRERELLKQAEAFTLDFEGGELACWRFAPLQSDKPLRTALLVHGWEGRAAQMGSLVEPLQRQGYQVYLLDFPAHGDSDGFKSNPFQFTRAIQRVGQKLGHIDLLVAHSLGAYASMRAIQAGLTVKRFFAVAGVVYYRVPMRSVRRMFRVPPSAKAEFDRQTFKALGIQDKSELDVIAKAPQLDIPCFYVHDPQDPDTPYFGAADMVEVLPQADLLAVREVGHRTIMWAPETVAALNQFAV